MAQPTSFRLPDDLVRRIGEEAADRGTSVTALVTSLIDEGLKTQRFPGVVYRDGATGRRAAVAGGPDVWEIVRALKGARGTGEQRIVRVARETTAPVALIRLAADFYAAYPTEIDDRLARDRQAGDRLKELISRRDRLLSE